MDAARDDQALDVDAYLARVGYRGPLAPSEDLLQALQRAQVFTIPFENLDIHLGRPIRLEPDALWAKLVNGQRGGYCYELNGLFRLVLQRLGFQVRCLGARNIMYDTPRQKSHQALLVTIGRRPWLADCGFGGNGLLDAIPLERDTVVPQFFEAFRIRQDESGLFRLESRPRDVWQPLYSFTLEEYYPLDYVMMNYYNSTHPDSAFTQRRMAARPTPDGRTSLSDRDLKIRQGTTTTTTVLAEGPAYHAALAAHFGIVLPADAVFSAGGAAAPEAAGVGRTASV